MAKLENKIAKTTLKGKPEVDITDVGISKTMQETISNKVKKAVAATLKHKGASAPVSSTFPNTPSYCSQVKSLKGQRKVQDHHGREGWVQECSTQEISLGKKAHRKSWKSGKKKKHSPKGST
jgi:hypothetical protein